MAKENQARIIQAGPRVLLLLNGKLACDMTWEGARDLGAALRACSNRARDYVNHEQVISDQALLTRSGAPFAIAGGKMYEEAKKEAQWGKTRRLVSASIRSEAAVGEPTIIQHPPKKEGNGHG